MSPAPDHSGAPRRILAIAPQPFYEDRGTPIAIRQLLRAHSEQGYAVDLLTFPTIEAASIPATGHEATLNVPVSAPSRFFRLKITPP